MIKKILSLTLSAIIVLGCSGCASASAASLTAQDVASRMGIGLNLGNTMEASNSTNCEKITYEWIPVVGNNTPKNYETYWGAVETTQAVSYTHLTLPTI